MREQKFYESDSPPRANKRSQKKFHDDYPRGKENFPNDDHSRFAGPDYTETSYFELGHEDPRPPKTAVPYQFTVNKMHAGKGPKGYGRADHSLYEEICDALMRDVLLDASGINIRVEGTRVIVEGVVADENMFDRTMGIIHHVHGSGEVINHLRIGSEHDPRGQGPEAVTQKDLGIGHYS